ncbi:MAG: DNA repair exonuclease [Clostridia bacterium]|nr:DNA repair exonuclease [Clostridia bacterium]
MTKIKVVHCADFHLGSPMSGVRECAEIRRDELLTSLCAVVDLCLEESVQVLLVAGDLFDSPYVSDEICRVVERQFSRLNIPVFIALGNHDYNAPGGVYSRMDLPSNVYVFDGAFSVVELQEIGLRVCGAGFSGEYCDQSLVGDFTLPDDDCVNVILLHGDVVSSGGSSKYNPIDIVKLSQSGADYCALGHIHKRTLPMKIGTMTCAYSGSVESRGFDETGEKGVYIGTVSKEGCDLDFRRICKRVYHDVNVDVSGCETADEVYKTVEKSIVGDKNRDLYKITLNGKISAHVRINTDVIKNRLDVFYVKFINEIGLALDYEMIKKERSLRGAFLREMLACRDKCVANNDFVGAGKYERAIEYGMRAFENEVNLYED